MSGSNEQEEAADEPTTFVEGLDFYYDDGMMVLTRRYLLNRGYCCSNGCRHCPYGNSDLQKING